jgi:hypothetical protein
MYTIIPFITCPDFKDLFSIAKDYYIIPAYSHSGSYAIVPELSGPGKINTLNIHAKEWDQHNKTTVNE